MESAAAVEVQRAARPAPSVHANDHVEVSELQLHLFNLDISLVYHLTQSTYFFLLSVKHVQKLEEKTRFASFTLTKHRLILSTATSPATSFLRKMTSKEGAFNQKNGYQQSPASLGCEHNSFSETFGNATSA